MRVSYKKGLGLLVISGFLLVVLLNSRSPGSGLGVDLRPGSINELETAIMEQLQDRLNDYHDISYHIKEDVAWWVLISKLCSALVNPGHHTFAFQYSRLARNTCSCVADKETFHLPFSNLFFPRVKAHNPGLNFLQSHPDPEGVKQSRAREYSGVQMR